MEHVVHIQPRGELPLTIQLRPCPRLDTLAQEIAEHERASHELEKEIQSLEIEAQRLDQSQTYSPEMAQRRAAIKRQLRETEQRLLESQTRRKRAQDERSQWAEQMGMKEYTRRLLWQELPEARPGPVSDWSMTRMYNFGQKEQRTRGDVRRDLVDCLTWLLSFGGPDAELQRELEQLLQEEQQR